MRSSKVGGADKPLEGDVPPRSAGAPAVGLMIELYEDGGIRVSAPPPRKLHRGLVSSSAVSHWLRRAATHDWPVTVRGTPNDPVIAPVMERIRNSGVPFALNSDSPEPPPRDHSLAGIGDRFRPPSNLTLAARHGDESCVIDMVKRGAAPAGDSPAWRWLRKRGDIETTREYQQLTGTRSKNAPPGTTNAVVLNLIAAFTPWMIYGPIVVTAVVLGVVTVMNWPPPLDIVVGTLIFGLAWPALLVAFLLSPWAVPARVAFEGSNLWWQRMGHRWNGPAHLDQVEGVAAYVKEGLRPTPGSRQGPPSLGIVLAGDEFSPGSQGRASREARRWVGDRHYLRLMVVFTVATTPNRGIVSEILRHLPASIEMMPGTAKTLRKFGFRPPRDEE